MKREYLINALTTCKAESHDVLTMSLTLKGVKEHLEKMKDTRAYSLSPYYSHDMKNGTTYEEIVKSERSIAMSFMYCMFDLNKAYRKKTGIFLFEKFEATYETAEMLYDMLQACI